MNARYVSQEVQKDELIWACCVGSTAFARIRGHRFLLIFPLFLNSFFELFFVLLIPVLWHLQDQSVWTTPAIRCVCHYLISSGAIKYFFTCFLDLCVLPLFLWCFLFILFISIFIRFFSLLEHFSERTCERMNQCLLLRALVNKSHKPGTAVMDESRIWPTVTFYFF